MKILKRTLLTSLLLMTFGNAFGKPDKDPQSPHAHL